MADAARDKFWHPESAEEVAAGQGITQPQSLDRLTGAAADLWESDEEFEEFLALMCGARPERKSA
jgi:hypothetical protein